MFLALCVMVHRFVVKNRLFELIFAGIENPKYDPIRPTDAFLAMYFCGSMPFIPIMSGLSVFFLYNIRWALPAFILGAIAAPFVIKVVWKVTINLLLVIGRNENKTG